MISVRKTYLSNKSATFQPIGFIPTYKSEKNTQSKDFIFRDPSPLQFGQTPFEGSEIRALRYNIHKEFSSDPSRTDLFDKLFSNLDWNYLIADDSLSLLASRCEQLFTNRSHLGSTRNPPDRKIDVTLPIHEPWRMVLENKHLRNSVNESLEKLTIPYRLEVSHVEEIHYKAGHDPISAIHQLGDFKSVIERIHRSKSISFVTSNGVCLSHKDLGYGVSTTLPMLVAIHSSRGKFVSVEQPELHIHPRIQTVLGDLFVRTSLAGLGCDSDDFDYENHIFYDPNENNYVFIETHSEHLILRILRRIRETADGKIDVWPDALREACPNGIRPEDVSVVYIKPPREGSKEGSTVIELPITPDGDFSKPWPDGFFEERFDEYE
jgi:hypothetical protein